MLLFISLLACSDKTVDSGAPGTEDSGSPSLDFIGMDFKEPAVDFVGLAQSMGVSSVRINKHEELAPALEAAIKNTEGPNLLSVTVDRGKF